MADDRVFLSSLDLSQMECGWDEAKADHNILGEKISIRGQSFEHGIGTHSPSRMRIQLDGKADRFTSVVGVDNSAEGNGSVEFLVIADGKTVWDSGKLSGSSEGKEVDLDIRGVRVLELRVLDGGDGGSYDHADWANSQFVMQPGAARPRSIPPYETIDIKTKSFALQFYVGDDQRLYQVPIGTDQAEIPPDRNEVAYPQGGDGYVFEPAIQVVHADGDRSTSLIYEGSERKTLDRDRELVRIPLRDRVFPFEVTLCFLIHSAHDVIQQWCEISHRENSPVTLERMASSSWLLPPQGVSLLHFYGDWADEMHPYVERLTPGTKVLDSKLGVRANQFTLPSFVLALDGEPQESQGRVLAGSLAWSGSFQLAFDHSGERLRALCGINPFSSAYHLPPEEIFQTPKMIWVWSDQGLGDMSRKFHRWAREFGVRDGNMPRDTLLNNWEATGFDFDDQRIVELFAPAKEMGVELFLLDDGWFGNRYPRLHDNAGLGDWAPNRARFPAGLEPVAQAAKEQGLRFGIWLEPEMVNPQSELYEAYPDWVIRQPKRELDLQRNQMILDLTRPEVREFEWDVIQGILSVPGISYAKWDANRYVTQPGSSYLSADRQTHLWIDYTRGLYELMAKTADTIPKTELMLCSGGGGRVDYGALQYFHEFWPSDNTDAVRRLGFQWDYSYFFPALSICSHVTRAGNRPLHFANAVAMSARFGMDLDIAKMSVEERADCQRAIETYKQIREVVHLGNLFRSESPHDSPRCVVNYVNEETTRAIVFSYQLAEESPRTIPVQGLDPDQQYRITELYRPADRQPVPDEGKLVSGNTLMTQGIPNSSVPALSATIIQLSVPK